MDLSRVESLLAVSQPRSFIWALGEAISPALPLPLRLSSLSPSSCAHG